LIKQFSSFGNLISNGAQKMADQPSFISAETDIKMFINANKSD
jgi:hypothetical protein